ncbi:MAG: DUF1292 domain-containing protein [Clostridia bacterium]|nr:DUF1292 domain-containing protein [Clostridia bacterium]
MADDKREIVVLLDEDGERLEFEHVLTFAYEGQRYAALTPPDDGEADEAEIVLLKIVRQDSEDVYVPIDNDVLLDEVFREFLDLMDEIEGDE